MKRSPDIRAPQQQFPAVIDGHIGCATVLTVNARDLHSFLEVGSTFRHWIARSLADYGFEDGRDFRSFSTETTVTGRQAREYHVSLDMAKELAMVERNDRGKQLRQ